MTDFRLELGGHIAEIPIIQGGMGVGYSLHSLASAVAKEGGIGVIATAGVGFAEPDFEDDYLAANIRGLQKEIRLAREKSGRGLLGVNIMVALSNYDDMARVSVEEGIDFIFSGAGLPLKLPSFVKNVPDCRTRLVPIVSSGRALEIITKSWMKTYQYFPDAAVIEGPMAGGHLGYKYEEVEGIPPALDDIFLDVKASADKLELEYGKRIPLIAAGGVYDGKDICHFLKLGAAGVQMGTRFAATEEADVSPRVKELYVNCSKDDIVIIKSPVGMPGRAINNDFLRAVTRGEKIPFKCPYHCIRTCKPRHSPYCIAYALINANIGKLEDGFAFAGSNVWRIDRIMTVPELVSELMSDLKKSCI